MNVGAFRVLEIKASLVSTTSIFRWALGLFALAALAGCHTPRVITGVQAESRFVYEGRPVHPLCVRFSLEQSSATPNDLSTCTGGMPVNLDKRGWLTADFAPGEGRGNVSYRVLAARGDRFLLATDVWGGGTGLFSNLFWVHLSHGQVTDERDERGGDRCEGGLSDFVVDSSTVRYNVSTTAKDVLVLAGVAVSDSLSRRMRVSYIDCDGDATYSYDPATYRSRLLSLTLSDDSPVVGADTGPPSPRNPRVCFDSLVRRYVAERRQTLSPAALKEFGREFSVRCVSG